MQTRRGFYVSTLLLAVTALSLGPSVARTAPAASPFSSDAEAIDFLLRARVVSMERIPVGVTEPRKVLLERDGVRAYAVFRDVDESIERVRLHDGTFHMKLHDSALFEVAAYRLAVLLGLDNVPPTVVRSIGHDTGSLQLWVDDAMSERERRERDLSPPDLGEWLHQMRVMGLFDTVIANVDRNPGNYLLTPDGKLWFIDHTRAFQMFPQDWSPEGIAFCDRETWGRLRALDRETLDAALGDVLARGEINKLAGRIEKVVAHIETQIAARGERAVIIAPPATPP
jgi:hypothetical protein